MRSHLATLPIKPTKRLSPNEASESLTTQEGAKPHVNLLATSPCVQRPSRASLGSRQHLGETRVGKSTSARHRSHRPAKDRPARDHTAQRMSSYGKRRTSRMLRRAGRAAENSGAGLRSHKPVRRILHACPPKQEKHDTTDSTRGRTLRLCARSPLKILLRSGRLSRRIRERLLTKSEI